MSQVETKVLDGTGNFIVEGLGFRATFLCGRLGFMDIDVCGENLFRFFGHVPIEPKKEEEGRNA